ncbi:MAG: hypothetical protein WA175_11485, partial [Candidatus Acidiferrales bacterium]
RCTMPAAAAQAGLRLARQADSPAYAAKIASAGMLRTILSQSERIAKANARVSGVFRGVPIWERAVSPQ